MSIRLLSTLSTLILLAIAFTACSGKQVAEPASRDSGADAAIADASDAAPEAEADAGLRQYPCTLSSDCRQYFSGYPSCVHGICCLGYDDGHGHCVCGALEGGCQNPLQVCCSPKIGPVYCTTEYCPY